MRNYKKILCLLISVLMIASFASCAKKDENTLIVATNAEFPPWESLDNGKVVGFDADLINLIGEKLGMKIKFENMRFEGVIASIPSNKCDIAISGLTINDTRKKSVDFSDPYYATSQILIVRNDDTVFTGTTKAELDEQLKNKKIGVCKGFTGVAYAEGDEEWGFVKIEGATINKYENVSLAAEDLKQKNIDVIIMDDTVAKAVVNASTNADKIKVINVALTTESYGIAVKKGNTELAEKINKALKELTEAGELDKLFERWDIAH